MPTPPSTDQTLRAENAELRARLEAAEEMLRVIRAAGAHVLVVEGEAGRQLLTLQEGRAAEQLRGRGEMIAQVSEAVLAVDLEQRITFLNAAAERLYGVHSDGMLGHKLTDIFARHWPSPEEEAAAWAALRERGEWHGSYLQCTHQGREVHVDSSFTALRDAHGEIIGYLSVIRDITERMRVETALRESEERLRLALGGSDLGTWHLDIRTGALDWSERCLEIFGIPPGTAMSYEKFLSALHPGDRARADDAVQRALQDGSEYRVEFRSVWPDGSVHWAVSQGRAYCDAAGEPTRMEGIAFDITELKRTEKVLQLTNERLTLAVKCSQVVLFQQDLELRYTWMQNPASGFDRPDAAGKRDADLMERAKDAAVTEALKGKVIRSGTSLRQEVTVQIEGVGRHYDLLVEPQRDAAGLITGITGAAIDITERKCTEEQLRLHRHLLETIVNYLPAAVALIRGSDLTFQMVNPGYQAISPGKQMVGRTIAEVWPETHPLFGQRCRHVVETGEPFEAIDERYEIHRDSDGPLETAYFSWSMRKVHLPDEVEPGLLLTMWETTARTEIELALAERTELLDGVLESTTDVIFVKDLNGRMVLANAAFAAAARSTPAQLVGKTDEDLFPPDVTAAIRQKDEAVIAGGLPIHFEETIPVAGAARVFHTQKAPLRDGSGSVVGILGISRDITERKQAGEALARLAAIVESSHDALFSEDLDGIVTSWNRGAEQIFGYRVDEIMGTSILRLIPEVGHAAELDLQRKIAAGERGGTFEGIRQAKDGRVFHASITVSPMTDAAGKIIGTSRVIRDITERRLAADSLREAKEAAEAANRSKDRFLAALSHELRTPLTPVLLVAGVHAKSKKLPEDVREAFEMIHRNVVLEAQLIDDLLDVSRIQQGKMRFSFKLVDVHEAIARSLEMLRAEVDGKGIAVRQELRATPAMMEADPVRLRQVLCNLLRNAVKFTPQGGTITVQTTRDPSGLQISIIDTGTGIAAEDLERIFQPFEQVDDPQQSEHRSLGLGLAISAAIVAAHRGRIWAESPGPGQGATLHVRLPF